MQNWWMMDDEGNAERAIGPGLPGARRGAEPAARGAERRDRARHSRYDARRGSGTAEDRHSETSATP